MMDIDSAKAHQWRVCLLALVVYNFCLLSSNAILAKQWTVRYHVTIPSIPGTVSHQCARSDIQAVSI